MTDYAEEQANEMEALEAIYPEELNVISTEPFHSFELTVSSQCDHDEAENVTVVMQFTYTAKYPDEAPVMSISTEDEVEDAVIDKLNEIMKEEVEENLGMAMVFTVVSAIQEQIDTIILKTATDIVDQRNQLKYEQEEAERKKFEGTRCTGDQFLAWKEKFMAELEEKKKLAGIAIVKKDNKKLTGKQLFLQDSTFDDSDVRFLEEEGEKVEVDESLFDDLDELDIDDELNDLES